VRPVGVQGNGFVVGKSTTKPTFNNEPLVVGQVARFVYGMVKHRSTLVTRIPNSEVAGAIIGLKRNGTVLLFEKQPTG
jgi:hypothetical protein